MIANDDEESRIRGGILIDWDLSVLINRAGKQNSARRRMRTVS